MSNSDLSVSSVLQQPELWVNAAYRFSIIKGPFKRRQTQSQDLSTILNTKMALEHYVTSEFLSANILENA